MPTRTIRGSLSGLALGAWLGAVAAGAATLDVPPGGNIQAALDAANPGDVVRLLDGVHANPSGLLMRNGVALEGESRDGAILDGQQTILDTPPANNAIVFDSTLTDSRTRVANLTITGHHGAEGGAVVVNGAQAGEIRGNRIHRNYALFSGAAIDVSGNASAAFLISFNLLHHNQDSQGDNTHTIDLRDTAAPTIQNNTFALNDDNGVFAQSTTPHPLIVNNIFFRNGTDHPPAVVLDAGGEPVSGVDENVGRGVCYLSTLPGPGVRLSHNLFFGNQRAAVLVQGPNAGDYENPLDLEAVDAVIAGSQYLPRGESDDTLFVDVAGEDFRILSTSPAANHADPSIPGVLHIGAEQAPVAPVPVLPWIGGAALAALLLARGARAARQAAAAQG